MLAFYHDQVWIEDRAYSVKLDASPSVCLEQQSVCQSRLASCCAWFVMIHSQSVPLFGQAPAVAAAAGATAVNTVKWLYERALEMCQHETVGTADLLSRKTMTICPFAVLVACVCVFRRAGIRRSLH